MKEKFLNFMQGRYGADGLNRFLSIAGMVLCVLSLITGWTVLYFIALVLLVFGIFRMFSRNTVKRHQENIKFYAWKSKITGPFSAKMKQFSQRKTHRFFQCPSCKNTLRVPKGVGKISISCPKCHHEFIKNS